MGNQDLVVLGERHDLAFCVLGVYDLNDAQYYVVLRLQRQSHHGNSLVFGYLIEFSVISKRCSFRQIIDIGDVYKFSDFGDSRRIIAGTISSGKLKVGDELVFYPSGKRTKIKTIESFNTPKLTCVDSGQAVGISMQEQIYVRRGQIASRAGDTPPFVSSRMRASIFWLGKSPLIEGKEYLLSWGLCGKK